MDFEESFTTQKEDLIRLRHIIRLPRAINCAICCWYDTSHKLLSCVFIEFNEWLQVLSPWHHTHPQWLLHEPNVLWEFIIKKVCNLLFVFRCQKWEKKNRECNKKWTSTTHFRHWRMIFACHQLVDIFAIWKLSIIKLFFIFNSIIVFKVKKYKNA